MKEHIKILVSLLILWSSLVDYLGSPDSMRSQSAVEMHSEISEIRTIAIQASKDLQKNNRNLTCEAHPCHVGHCMVLIAYPVQIAGVHEEDKVELYSWWIPDPPLKELRRPPRPS